jgi:hypothetical protein
MKGGLRPPFMYRQQGGPPGRAVTAEGSPAAASPSPSMPVQAPQPDSSPAEPSPADDLRAEAGDWPEVPDLDAAVAAWVAEDEAGTPETGTQPESAAEFPLDAFYVPADAERLPNRDADGDRPTMQERIADRLETMAAAVRSEGLAALGTAGSADELTRLVAAVVAGYIAREE